MSNNNMKFFDALVSKTKVYLVIIAILLLLICMLKPICIIPSIIIYAIIQLLLSFKLKYTIRFQSIFYYKINNFFNMLINLF